MGFTNSVLGCWQSRSFRRKTQLTSMSAIRSPRSLSPTTRSGTRSLLITALASECRTMPPSSWRERRTWWAWIWKIWGIFGWRLKNSTTGTQGSKIRRSRGRWALMPSRFHYTLLITVGITDWFNYFWNYR